MHQKKNVTTPYLIFLTTLLVISSLSQIALTSYILANSVQISASAFPNRIQQGENTTITVEVQGANNTLYTLGINVTNPEGDFSNASIEVTTNATGIGSNSTVFGDDFTGANTTHLVGTYNVSVINMTSGATVATTSFSVALISYNILANPNHIQEGFNTTITADIHDGKQNENYTLQIKVTDSRGDSFISNLLVETNETGFGSSSIKYWEEFQDANTDFVGVYSIVVNETLATANFTVGLTDKREYQRTENVDIRGTRYDKNENVSIDIQFNGASVEDYPKNVTADDEGIVTDSWQVPENATPGTYSVSITTLEGTTVKTPADTQDFEVLGVICQIQTVNLANQAVRGMLVEVYNSSTLNVTLMSGKTNATGWIRFNLDVGNYTFKAFWKEVEVGVISNVNATENKTLTLQSQLTNIKILVVNEAGNPVRLISLASNYNYTTRNNLTKQEAKFFLTNDTGTWKIHNMLTNISYLFKAQVYDLLFNETYVDRMEASPWFNFTITLPTYTAFIHVVDSRYAPVEGALVDVYEWSSGVSERARNQSGITDSDGNVTFSLNFGRYKIRVHKDATLLKETTIDVILNESRFVVYLSIYNVNLTVIVTDYFGQPIPNVKVNVTRTNDLWWSNMTGLNGKAAFTGILGGDSRISVYTGGQLSGTKDIYLTNSKEITFKLNRYVVLAGFLVEVSQFVTVIALVIMIATFIVAFTYKRLPKIFVKSK